MALQRWLIAVAIIFLVDCFFTGYTSTHCASTLCAAESQIQVIDFTAKSCAPCQSMQPVIVRLAKEGWHIRQVDVETERQLIEPFQVKSVPTLVVLRDGKEVDRIVGALGYEKLKGRLQQAKGPSSTDSLKDDFLAMVAPSNANGQSGFHAAEAKPAASNVRGQSPIAFPMLSSAGNALGSAASSAAALGSLDMNAAPAQAAEQNQPFAQLASAQLAASQAPAMQPLASSLGVSPGSSSSLGVPPGSSFNNAPRAQNAPQSMRGGLSPDARAQAATVRIRVDEPNAISYGTGTVINMHDGQALVLTCGHIFRDMTPQAKLSVDVYQQGQSINVPAQVVTFNAKEADIGLIEFRAPFAIEPVPVAPLAASPQIGHPAFSFGCDKGADPTRRNTQIKRINRYLGAANVEIHGAPVVGRSGGGLFDAEGRLIGICNAADEEDDEGIYAALPVIHGQLSALQLDNLTQPPANANNVAINNANNASNVAAQIQCVIRDAQGRQSTLVIDRPSESLLAMLRSSANQ